MIEIEFSALQGQYVTTQPLHSSQTLVSSDDGRYVFRYFLVPNYEFYAAILACGDEVKVLKPEEVRDKLVEILNSTIGRYGD